MRKRVPNALVVGGTSGLGLRLALLLAETHRVTVTGRQDPRQKAVSYRYLNLDVHHSVKFGLNLLVDDLPRITMLIWAAATEEGNTLSEVTDGVIETQLNLGPRGAAMLLARLLRKQAVLKNFIAITSTSQVTPRLHEPNYCAAKAGLAMLAQCAAQDDEAFGRVLVAAPSGMNTPFWRNHPRDDAAKLLSPKRVAREILRLHAAMKEKFEAWMILRSPMRSIRFMEDSRKK